MKPMFHSPEIISGLNDLAVVCHSIQKGVLVFASEKTGGHSLNVRPFQKRIYRRANRQYYNPVTTTLGPLGPVI